MLCLPFFLALNFGSVISESSVNKTGKLLLLRANTIAFLCLRQWCAANVQAVIHILPVYTNIETHPASLPKPSYTEVCFLA